ncbi:MAG: MarR family transcriptional regulator [Oscillospiraceae bacterium]|jgi:DNA-binding MarR family transcriptional regulator|nr:MarR family transcriptional regulator [Oscillospiraceae bacterium]
MTEYRSVPLVKQVCEALEREVNNAVRSQGLTYSQIQLLLRLEGAEDGGLPLKALEEMLNVSQATVVGLAKRLTRKGFAELAGDPRDKRAKRVRLTPLGAVKCEEAHAHMDAIERKLNGGFTEIETRILFDLLRKAGDNFR